MSSLLRKLLFSKKLSPNAKTDPLEAARDNQLNKAGKIQLGQEAVVLGQLKDIADDEVESVRALKAKHGLGGTPPGSGGEKVGDLIICDDYRRNDPPKGMSGVAKALVGAALAGGLGLGGLGLWCLSRPAPPAAPTAAPVKGKQYDAIYEVQQPDGTWKEVRRERLK